MNLEYIRSLNPDLHIYTTKDYSFHEYGRCLSLDTDEILENIERIREIPNVGTTYETDISELHEASLFNDIQENIYGKLPIQAGLVCGKNTQLTGIEFHQGSEVNIAVTDCILLLGKKEDLKHECYDVNKIKAFYIKRGEALEIYSTTLHYTPLQVHQKGFALLVFLLLGTNMPIENPQGMLTKMNKWYITHPSQEKKIEEGCIPGLLGDMVKIIID